MRMNKREDRFRYNVWDSMEKLRRRGTCRLVFTMKARGRAQPELDGDHCMEVEPCYQRLDMYAVEDMVGSGSGSKSETGDETQLWMGIGHPLIYRQRGAACDSTS